MNLRLALAIARKDILDAARNLYLAGAIAMPLGFWLLFRIILPSGGDLQIENVVIHDAGSSRLVAMIESDPMVAKVTMIGSRDELTEVVRDSAVGGLAIPAGFDEAVAAGESPELAVLINGRRGGGELTAFRRLVDNRLQALDARPPVATVSVRDVQASTTSAAALGAQGTILVLLVIMGLAMAGTFVVPTLIVEEKERHTLKTILVSPASYADVVVGKGVAGLFYALLGSGLIAILYGDLRPDWTLMILAIVLGGIVMVEIGLFLGAVFNTTGQVNSWSSIVLLALILPSWLTGFRMPGIMEAGMRLLPSYYVVQLLDQAGGGAGTMSAELSVAVLVAFAAAIFVLVVWTLRRAER